MNAQEFTRLIALAIVFGSGSARTHAQTGPFAILPEQRCLSIRNPDQMTQVAAPTTPRPATVTDPQAETPAKNLSLDEAINIMLANSEVVRVLGGVTASTSGRSIYDAAIANTAIDNARSTFDPNLRVNNTWSQSDRPVAVPDPLNPGQALFTGAQSETHQLDVGVVKRNLLGGTSELGVLSGSSVTNPSGSPLSPADSTATALRYSQPLLRGAGQRVNRAPIVLARIDTERSYFQYKRAVQQSVQGVISAYWALVLARTDQWARQQQVKQAEFANARTLSRKEVGDASAGDLAQTQLALENFRASLLVSDANVLQRQAALLNILGLPAYEAERTVPTSQLVEEKVTIDWEAINEVAQRFRPDIIELKLILEADQQNLLLADNDARPQLDAVALYQWNGLEGVVPVGNRIRTDGGQFTDWSLGVNFSVPIGLRSARATLRRQQLIIQRDRANLDQGLHQMQHLLALSLRNLDQFYAQYQRFQAVRRAARTNLEQQLAQYNEGLIQFIVVLQAIVDWGNAVSAEAQALTQYNTELANLELQTGTILETHEIVFFEERFQAIGPLGRLGPTKCYPRSQPATPSVSKYSSGEQPSETYFNLDDPVRRELVDPDPGEKMEMDEDVQFERIGPVKEGPVSDEEIDQILNAPRTGKRWKDYLIPRWFR